MDYRALTDWKAYAVGETIKERDQWSQQHLPRVRVSHTDSEKIGYLDGIRVWNGVLKWSVTSLGFFTTDRGWSCWFDPNDCELIYIPNEIPLQPPLF